MLAGNSQFVSAFSALLEAPRATHDQANALRQAYRALIEPIEATHKTTQASYLPGDNSFKEFARLQESILQALEPYRRDLASVEAMRATARQQNQPAPYALADVIAREHERAALTLPKSSPTARQQRGRKQIKDSPKPARNASAPKRKNRPKQFAVKRSRFKGRLKGISYSPWPRMKRCRPDFGLFSSRES